MGTEAHAAFWCFKSISNLKMSMNKRRWSKVCFVAMIVAPHLYPLYYTDILTLTYQSLKLQATSNLTPLNTDIALFLNKTKYICTVQKTQAAMKTVQNHLFHLYGVLIIHHIILELKKQLEYQCTLHSCMFLSLEIVYCSPDDLKHWQFCFVDDAN